MKVKRIFTKSVATELIRYGFELIRVEDHYKHSHLKVFVFEETQAFLDKLTDISSKK